MESSSKILSQCNISLARNVLEVDRSQAKQYKAVAHYAAIIKKAGEGDD